MFSQVLELIPNFSIPSIFSHLQGRDIGRCACVANTCAAFLQLESIATKIAPAKARAKLNPVNIYSTWGPKQMHHVLWSYPYRKIQ